MTKPMDEQGNQTLQVRNGDVAAAGTDAGRQQESRGRHLRVAVLTLLMALLMGGVAGVADGTSTAAASNGYEEWVDGFSDGCAYYWDGYAYTASACPRTDGGFNFYTGSEGQWVYSYSAGFLSDGGVWLYYQGQYYYNTVSNGYVDGIYPTTSTIGGTTDGGRTYFDVVANQFNIDLIVGSNNTTLRPNCRWEGDICYY